MSTTASTTVSIAPASTWARSSSMPSAGARPAMPASSISGILERSIGTSEGSSEVAQHAGVAEGVGLDPGQVEELRHPLVVRPDQLLVDDRLDRRAVDDREAVPGEEVDLESEHEHPG